MEDTSSVHVVAAVPGLLGFLSDDQRAVLFALAGMDQDAPRTLAEAAAVLDLDAETLGYQQALVNRQLLHGVLTPDPQALRLRALLVTEGGLAEAVGTPGLYSVQRLVPALRAPAFPMARAMSVVALWAGGNPEHTYPTGIRILAPDRRVLHTQEMPLRPVGLGAVYAQEYRLVLEFPEPGLYAFQMWLIGGPLYTDYLPVYHLPEAEDEATPSEGNTRA